MLLFEASFGSVIVFLSLILFKNAPLSPANRSSKRKREKNYLKSGSVILKNGNLYILAVCYGLIVAAMNVSATVQSEVI